ncbi:hypothetical protein H0H81_010292 [Sphagnurus paluster]|uniref:SGNH hydrolase-type esterase domain-containing protein n=1 Tax=Sphagnurus paluster TaxID=117069 RepID=A0A9P7GPY8_9AGAR|nr:hypothetical protein H0H81_010292 [Sphagnurus paluster]
MSIINAAKQGDYVIIEFGHNDVSAGAVDNGKQCAVGDGYDITANVKNASFAWYIENAINELVKKGAIPIICSLTPNNTWSGNVIAAGGRFVGYAKSIGTRTKITYIDHYAYTARTYEELGEVKTNSFYPNDHLHTNAAGANVVAQAFIRGLLCGNSTLKDQVNSAGQKLATTDSTTDGPDESLKPARRTPPTGFTSPHDAILAQILGQPHSEDSGDGLLRDHNSVNQNNESLSHGVTPTGSTSHDRHGCIDILYDPFDGTPLGQLSAPLFEGKTARLSTKNASLSSVHRIDVGNNEQQWIHLSRVLELQNEVAKMHLEMENVGIGDGKGKGSSKARSRGKGQGLDTHARERKTPKRSVTVDTIVEDAHDGDEEGVDAAGDEEIERRKAREEQFANLADQFEGRKESIQEIMSKLDDLSKALTEFHTLQAPSFEFSKLTSHQNSATPDRTPPLTQKSSPYVSDNLPVNASSTNIPRSRVVHSATAESNIPASFTRSVAGKTNSGAASLIVNALEPGKQTHIMDSPDSMKGRAKLPPE